MSFIEEFIEQLETWAMASSFSSTAALPGASPIPVQGEPANDTKEQVLPDAVYVLLPLEARARGFRNALAFRRWCQRHHVPIIKDGRMQWVRRSEVDSAIQVAAIAPVSNSPNNLSKSNKRKSIDPVAVGVEAIVQGQGKR